MIRRDLKLPDGRPGWLLISQVSHAQLSGELAARCPLPLREPDAAKLPSDSAWTGARSELLAAISHHDDGWLDWDMAPQLDPQQGRPLSFLEMPRREMFSIWDRSIDIARGIGRLAAWTVTGHFLRLLEYSQSSEDQALIDAWREGAHQRRSAWFCEWTNDVAPGVQDAAERAVDWLQLFDVLSLWLCRECPLVSERSHAVIVGEGRPLQTQFRSLATDDASPPSGSGELAFQAVTARPWRFSVSQFNVQLPAHWVPAQRYSHTGDLLAARVPYRLRWQMVTGD